MVALWINKDLFIRLASSKEAVDEDEEGVAKPRELLLLVKRVVYVKLTSRFKIPSAPLSSSLSRSLSLSLALSLSLSLSPLQLQIVSLEKPRRVLLLLLF